MSEHSIRLRGGWERRDRPAASDAETPTHARLTLPLAFESLDAPVGPIRLLRRFNAPPLDRRIESLSLRLEDVPGLVAVRLNGRLYDGPLTDPLTIAVESFGPLEPRNVLELDVDPARAGRPAEGWGRIALVVNRADETGSDS